MLRKHQAIELAVDTMTPFEGHRDPFREEEKKIEEVRILLANFTCELSAFLSPDVRGLPGQGNKKEVLPVLGQVSKVFQAGYPGKEIIIRYQGKGPWDGVPKAEDLGYVMGLGDLSVDLQAAEAISGPRWNSLQDLPSRLSGAFERLTAMGIYSFHVSKGDGSPEHVQRIGLCMEVLSRYFETVSHGAASLAETPGPPGVVFDEYGRPDPNLSILAGMNGVQLEKFQGLIQKIHERMKRGPTRAAFERYGGVYDALLSLMEARGTLRISPLRVNDVRALVRAWDQGSLTVEEARIVRSVVGLAGSSPVKTGRILEAIYGNDYGIIGPEALVERLRVATLFLETLDKAEHVVRVGEAVVQALIRRLEMVRDGVVDQLVLLEDAIGVRGDQKKGISARVHGKLRDVVHQLIRQVRTRRKMWEKLKGAVGFDERDREVIAADLKISPEEAEEFFRVLRDCFDRKGHFLRGRFERGVSEIGRYGSRGFDILWRSLQGIGDRRDRLGLLNSLQFLTGRMREPKQAMRTLLDDVVFSPSAVHFVDRNALILANILLRSYNKEGPVDIEHTPEEVLLVRGGLQRDMVREARAFIEAERQRVFMKTAAIHSAFRDALTAKTPLPGGLPLGYLSALERELWVFMSLVGGSVAHRVVRNALEEYGDPGREIYSMRWSRGHARELFRLLQVTIRGIGRFRDPGDIALLEKITGSEQSFMDFAKRSGQDRLVKRLMGWVERSQKAIQMSDE